MAVLDISFAVISHTLPVYGRTVYKAIHLFVVMNQLFVQSGICHHPIDPMTDSDLPCLMKV